MFLLVSSVTFTNFTYAQTAKGQVTQLKVLEKNGYVEDDPCDLYIDAFFEWTLVDESGKSPKTPMYLVYEMWIDGKLYYTYIHTNYDIPPNFSFGLSKLDSSDELYEDNVRDLIRQPAVKKYKSELTIKSLFIIGKLFSQSEKEQTVTLRILKVGPASSGFVYSGNGDPITIKIPGCPKEPPKPKIYYLKPADPFRVISEIEEMTRKTTELLDKQFEKREQERKLQKEKSTKAKESSKKEKTAKDSKKEDRETLTELYTAMKWAEYANKQVYDAVKKQSKEIQDRIKEKESRTSTDKDGIRELDGKLFVEYGDILKISSKISEQIKKINNDIKKEAKESKVPQADLNKAAKQPIDKLKSKKEITPSDKIKEAQKAVGETTLPLAIIAQGLGGILDSDRIEEEELKKLPGLADTLTVKNKEGLIEGNVCDGYVHVTVKWELVTPRGVHPDLELYISIDIFDDGKKIVHEGFWSPAARNYQGERNADFSKKLEPYASLASYPVHFDPKKGKTLEFKLADTQYVLPEKYALLASQFPITITIPKCEIDSVIDDLTPTGPITDQDLPVHDKKSDKSPQSKDKKEPAKSTDPAKTKDKTTPTKKPEEKKVSSKPNDEMTVIKAYSVATTMSSSPQKQSDLDVLKNVKNELTAEEYRRLIKFLDAGITDMRNSADIPLKDTSPITDKERAHMLVQVAGLANLPTQMLNELEDQSKTITKTPQGKPDFKIFLKPDSVTLPSGGYEEVEVTVKSINGWNEMIWLSIPIPIGPIRYPTIVPNLVTPAPNSDVTADFAVDVSPFSCPGKYRMLVYGMSQGSQMEIESTYFNLEILHPGKVFELSTDQKMVTIQKGSSKSFELIVKNLDKISHGYLISTADSFKAPAGVTLEYNTLIGTEVGETDKGTITIKTSKNIKTPMKFTLPMQAETALNCHPPFTETANVVVNIVGSDDSAPDQILIPGSEYTKPTTTKPAEPKPSNTKPTLTIPKQVTQEATGPSGASVTYSTSSQDKEDGSITPTCDHSSGSTFPIGATSVTCTAKDSNNNSVSGSFTVTVRDTTPPNIPAFQPTEGVRDETGVQVFFTVTAYDLVDGDVQVSCNYPSGYKFPIGVTVLTCTADDSRGNHGSRSLQITVTVQESGQ